MDQAGAQGRVELSAAPDGTATVRITGSWTLQHFAEIERSIQPVRVALPAQARLDLDGLGALDTAGAGLLSVLLGPERLHAMLDALPDLAPERRALLETVGGAVHDIFAHPPTPPSNHGFIDLLAQTGRAVQAIWCQSRLLLGFVGLTLETLARNLLRPHRWRMAALVKQIEQTTLDALPIVSLLSFMVGAVIAFLGATVLRDYGASVFTVDLVSFAFLREFGVLLAAILLAGRTASAFTAQLGAMQAHEEIDAIRTLGLDPIEVLVLPRVLALMLGLPMLTFVAMLAGILGGALVCVLAIGIPPAMFLSLFHADTPLRYFWVGMSKAPVLAFLIAIIGCLEGFKVTGSAESVGERTTSSVVQAIFVVILVDALAALFFMEMGW
ncbi:MAG: ABC transporter permease [Xanthomonadaceae bacterium]|nr:ABC transporter permease [Xanthomonadaceae bacterium]MDE2244986.1 ABC transporter permease [Xanthomonadaceae bacterium]